MALYAGFGGHGFNFFSCCIGERTRSHARTHAHVCSRNAVVFNKSERTYTAYVIVCIEEVRAARYTTLVCEWKEVVVGWARRRNVHVQG